MNDAPKAKVYYNSACPVCRAGVESQRDSMAACGIDQMEWIDVHRDPDAAAQVGATLEQVRERLYVKDERGELKIGAAAFADLWSRTPRQRWAGRLLELPILRTIAHWAYNVFARGLYRWNLRKKHW